MNSNKVAIFNIISTVILQGLTFISGPIFSGILGPNNYGIASVYLTWVQVASTVFSLQAAGTLAVARVNFPMEDQEKYQSSVMCLSTLSYLCFSIVTIFVACTVSDKFSISVPMVIFGLAQGWGSYCSGVVNSKFTYEFKADKNLILSVVSSVLVIGVSLVLVNVFPSEINYWGRIIAQSVVYTGIGLILFIFLLKRGKTVYNKDYWKFTLPISIPTIFHLLSYTVLNQCDKIMLQSMVSNSVAGIYSLACSFGGVINTIYSALNNSWVPFYFEYTRNNQIDEMKRHAHNYIELFTILCMGFILLSREVFHIYAKESFWEGTDLIPLLSIGYYFVFMYSFPVNYEFYNKKTKTIAFGTAGAAIFNIILNYIFIKLLSIQGAVIVTVISHGLQFLFHYICARNMLSKEFPFRIKEFIPGLIAVCLTCAVYMFTKGLWFVRWGLGAVLGVWQFIKIVKRREIF